MLHLTASQVKISSIQITMAMSDSQLLNTSLQEVMISSNNERVLIHDLNDHTLPIIFHTWWAFLNVGSKHSVAWNTARHAPLWQLYLHYCIEQTGSPGIICIVSHQVLPHPSEHETCSMGKYLLAKAPIAKLHKLTKSEVTKLTSSVVDETALVILKRQGSCGIQIVSLQRMFTFDFRFYLY
jgi:hypothetical protein